MEPKLLIIAGMHRSGTSLIAQWLNKCGLNVGDDLMEANRGNEQGYFEDNEFVYLHEDLLRTQGLPGTGLTDMEMPGLPLAEKVKVARLLNNKTKRHAQWGWKDPRTCLFLRMYRELAPHARYIVIYRDYRFCVHSLVNRMLKEKETQYLDSGKRNAPLRWKWYKKARISKALLHIYAEEFLKVWIRYNNELLYHVQSIENGRYTVLDYHFLLSNDRKLFDFLTGNWHFDLVYTPFGEVYSKKLMSKHAFIDPYIKDKNLLKIATELGRQLQACTGMMVDG